MQQIVFYEDIKGNSPVRDYTNELACKNDDISKNHAKKISYQIRRLETYGTRNGMPIIRHIEDDIWELRPIPDRILFAAWIEDSFILLHHFRKDTKKTPRREIDKAKRELEDYRQRNL